ncbi:Rpn family recombination-promoting nuclease/putative transposase [Phaeodactylibacter xiamenensis]|uniref:Rpn family recombination-promoting nuclease/putative transposase n=1 Tax=Phaeodactylibacter xiamenensis TaxID=1524460 RepID=UPI003CCBA41D
MPQNLNVHQPDDRFFKSAMSDPEVVKAYLQHFYPNIAAIADLASLKLENSVSLRPNLKRFEADVIYRCRFQGEADDHFYFCLLFEHKSKPDKYIAVQVGSYIMELLSSMVKKQGRELEPVLPLIFYNGKEKWMPQTLSELFQGHPHYAVLEPYIPNFRFLFQDATRLSPEELLRLDLSYFRSVLMSMAFRHRQHLIFKYLQLIFEGTDGKEKVSAVTTYILGVAERSEEEFLKQIQDTTFTIKPEVMSTLEQILERGRKEGLEKGMEKGMEKGIEKGIEKGMDRGVYKNSIFNLLKTAVHFPDWPAEKLADFTELSMEVVAAFLSVKSEGDAAALKKYVREDLLTDLSHAKGYDN